MQRFPDIGEFTLVWEIRNFPLYMTLHQKELESPPFFIKCTEVIGWFLVLRPRDHVLDCSLYRLNRMDDLSDIQIKYQISVVSGDGTLHFTKSYTSNLTKEVRSVHVPDFLDTSLLDVKHMPDCNLRLQCDLEIIIQNDVTTKWNFNNDLLELSRDMLRLYKTGQGSDRRLHVDDSDFKVHALVVAARCPDLKMHFTPEDRSMDTPPESPNRAVTFQRIREFVHLLELPPKSRVQERTAKSKAAARPRQERFLKIFDHLVCDAFLNYLYSGRYEIRGRGHQKIDDDMKLRLLIVARRYRLMDMVRKLQEVEYKCKAVTELVMDTATLDFDLGFLQERKVKSFKPITKLVNLSSTGKRYLQVTFSIVSDNSSDSSSNNSYDSTDCSRRAGCLQLKCKLLESVLPVTMKTEIELFNTKFLETPEASCEDFVSFSRPNESWTFTIAVKITNRLKCSFTVCSLDSVRMSRQEFSISSTRLPDPQSLRQLRYDLAAVLAKSEHSGDDRRDLTLIVDGKMLRAHRLVVCARSTALKERLEPVTRQALQDVDFDSLVSVVEYMYTGILFEKDDEKLRKLRQVAEEFVMPELLNTCNKFLGE